MNILFASADSIALKTLEVVSATFGVVGVLTSQARGSGRKKSVNEIALFAEEHSVPVLAPERLGSEVREAVKALGADFLLSFSYSRIFGPKFLSLFNAGTMNIHPSALPEFRGPSPLQSAILAGKRSSAVSFQEIALGMDEGDIFASVEFGIGDHDTTSSLRDRVSEIAADNIVGCLSKYPAGRRPQSGEATYTRLISKEDGHADFSAESAKSIELKVRALNPWPGVRCEFCGKALFLLEAFAEPAGTASPSGMRQALPGTIIGYDVAKKALLVMASDAPLAVTWLMAEGRKRQSAADFHNGCRGSEVGEVLRGITV